MVECQGLLQELQAGVQHGPPPCTVDKILSILECTQPEAPSMRPCDLPVALETPLMVSFPGPTYIHTLCIFAVFYFRGMAIMLMHPLPGLHVDWQAA